MITDADLEFVETRHWSPQWEVKHNGMVVARVTERIIATPTYVVNYPDYTETFHDDRESVTYEIVAKLAAENS